jgi:DNA-binding MarR family transcriptional regulator
VSDKRAVVAAWESLFRAQVAVMRDLTTEFPAGGLSFNEYDVLFNLSRQPGRRLRIKDLNRQLLLSQPSVSRLIDRLVTRGIVSKCSDERDARGIVVKMTDEGFELYRRVAVKHIESINDRVGSALTDGELEQLRVLTEKLRKGDIR